MISSQLICSAQQIARTSRILRLRLMPKTKPAFAFFQVFGHLQAEEENTTWPFPALRRRPFPQQCRGLAGWMNGWLAARCRRRSSQHTPALARPSCLTTQEKGDLGRKLCSRGTRGLTNRRSFLHFSQCLELMLSTFS